MDMKSNRRLRKIAIDFLCLAYPTVHRMDIDNGVPFYFKMAAFDILVGKIDSSDGFVKAAKWFSEHGAI